MSDLPLSAIDEKVYPPYKIAFLVEVLQEEGVAASETLSNSGLDAQTLGLPNTRTSLRQLLTVYENTRRLSKDPAIALRVGRRIHITHYGMYGYALFSSPTIRDACEFSIRYHKLATPAVNMGLREKSGIATWVFESAFELDPGGDLYRFIMEFQFGIYISLFEELSGTPARPLEVHAIYAAPPYADQYRTYLGCPVYFGQPANELRFNTALLDARPNLANPITAAMLREICDRLLNEMQTTSGIASKVHGMLLKNPGQFPDIETVADELHMVSRTLRRKLEAQGTSYQQILSDVRKQLALRYLRETRLSTEDIAGSLGFSDASSFRHAFKRWTNKNPSDFRPA